MITSYCTSATPLMFFTEGAIFTCAILFGAVLTAYVTRSFFAALRTFFPGRRARVTRLR